MTIIDENQAQAARKAAMSFHKRHDIKSLNEITPHKLTWGNLNALQADVSKQARATLDKAENADDSEAKTLGDAHDAFMAFHAAVEAEKDIRTAEGGKGPRPQAATRAQLAKRPTYAEVTDNGEPEVAEIALRPDQRFKTWAQAKGQPCESAQGMNIGSFLRAIVSDNKSEQERRALSEATNSAGGFTVPDVLSAELIDVARARSVVVQAGARTVPITSDSNTIAKVLTDPVPAWRLEAGAVAESDPTFGSVQLTPRSLAVKMDVSAELMQDSLNLEQALPNILAQAMAVELDRVALEGTGVAPQPTGILNTAGIGTFAQGAVTSSYANLSKARTAILTANRGMPTAFIMHPREEGMFVDLVDSNGNPLVAPDRIAEIPMLTTTSIAIDGGTGSDESTIYAGNFNHLLIGMRQNVQVELLKVNAYASNLQFTLVAHMRADIAVEDPAAFFTLTGVGDAA